MQHPLYSMALNNRLREQPNCFPRDVLSLLLSPANRASFSHALGFAWPDWSLYGRRVARHKAGGYENHLDEIGFVGDKTHMAFTPTLCDRVIFGGVALQGDPSAFSLIESRLGQPLFLGRPLSQPASQHHLASSVREAGAVLGLPILAAVLPSM